MNCFSRVVSIIYYISSNSVIKIRVLHRQHLLNSLQSISMVDLNIETALGLLGF